MACRCKKAKAYEEARRKQLNSNEIARKKEEKDRVKGCRRRRNMVLSAFEADDEDCGNFEQRNWQVSRLKLAWC